MAQHDYVIDNQASASARADLNLLFQAIASHNSGATAPATTYANMMWYDTSTDLLKVRNEANTVWITLGTVDQTNNVFNPNFLPATQAEAEAGTNNVKGMTALRVSQAITALSPARNINIQAFTTSSTYTPTSGYSYAIGFCTGGGQSGGGGTGGGDGDGGNAGGTVISSFQISGLGAQTVTVGAGGTTAVGTGVRNSGGTSSLGSILSAYGGGQTVAFTGLVQINGATGGTASLYDAEMGGGSFWGGGAGGTSGAGGVAATAYGAGGGGGSSASSSYNGGAGKSGIVVIMEFK